MILTVVGFGLRISPGVFGNILNTLSEQKVNIIAMALGSFEASISLVVNAPEMQDALNAIHNLICQPNREPAR